jgi:hypothetical protein
MGHEEIIIDQTEFIPLYSLKPGDACVNAFLQDEEHIMRILWLDNDHPNRSLHRARVEWLSGHQQTIDMSVLVCFRGTWDNERWEAEKVLWSLQKPRTP